MYNSTEIRIHSKRYLDRDYYIGATHLPIVNASIGTSQDGDSFITEIQKAHVAISAGAEMITDHSISGDVAEFHHILRESIHTPLACVPIYGLSLRHPDFSPLQAIDEIEQFLDRGFNVIVLHASVLAEDCIKSLYENRIIPVTSKGGQIMIRWMRNTKSENPFFFLFDDILELVKKYSAVISLAPCFRPASVYDNSLCMSDSYWVEVSRMAMLVKKAIASQVPIIVEGIGHAQLTNIPHYVKQCKDMCFGVPYKVLTVSTDIALGYDNISSAIAASMAVLSGANIVTAVTSAEHITLPNIQQVEDAVVAARIAIHSATLCWGEKELERDRCMSVKRMQKTSCQGSADYAIFPNGARRALKEHLYDSGCSMCGELCAYKKEAVNNDS